MAKVRPKVVSGANSVAQYLKPSRADIRKYKLGLLLGRSTVSSKSRVIYFDYQSEVQDQIPNLIDYLEDLNFRGGIDFNEKKEEVSIGSKGSVIRINFRRQVPADASTGVTPPKIQEKGTTVVFNRVLKNDKTYRKEEDLLNDKILRKELEDVFGDWSYRIPVWIHTYFEQQKLFLKEYESPHWDEFVYDGKDFVTFFRDNLKSVIRTPNGEPVDKYEDWNPADIWAAYDLDQMQKDIKKQMPILPQTIGELNNLLVKLIAENKLVGISLKQIKKGDGSIHVYNTKPSSLKLTKIEKVKLKDIKFDVNNIFESSAVLTNVVFGQGKSRYEIKITRASNANLVFNTYIAATPDAQGGQSIKTLMLKLLNSGKKNITFRNEHTDYPADAKEWYHEHKQDKYKEWYDLVIKEYKGRENKTYDKFANFVLKVYEKDKRAAIGKIGALNFWYDALNNFNSKPDDAEFWTDLLYLGLKIGSRGQFGPYAKIS